MGGLGQMIDAVRVSPRCPHHRVTIYGWSIRHSPVNDGRGRPGSLSLASR